jgi:hypothetical protein
MSVITNCWGHVRPVRLDVAESTVYTAAAGRSYSHHPHLAGFGGRLYATWSLGETHEDDPGQRMVMSVSDDRGENWSTPRDVTGRLPGEEADAVVTSGGIFVASERLVAWYAHYEFVPGTLDSGHRKPSRGSRHRDTYTAALVSDDGGETWHSTSARIDNICLNQIPRPLASGRLLMTSNMLFPYTDDPTGLSGWRTSGLPRLPAGYQDEPFGFPAGNVARGDTTNYCEGSFFQTDDGTIHMMLRTGEGRMAVSISRDEGATWSEPALTDYTDCGSKSHFGRLPDGRFFGLTTPARHRTPLVLAVSEDGCTFDRHFILGERPWTGPRFEGLHKGGYYGYPWLHVEGNRAWAIYSACKEDVAVVAFDLAQIA